MFIHQYKAAFDIALTERNNQQLRPNMKVDVFLVKQIHNQVMRVSNGAAFKVSNPQEVLCNESHDAMSLK